MAPAPQPRKRYRPWKILGERVIYAADPYLRLTRQHVLLPDGRHIRDYHQVRFPDYVTVGARSADGRYLLLEKYNHGFRCACLLFPGGLCDPAESPLRAARRELLEETGYVARRWRCLGHFRPHSNYGCGQVHFFFADGCRPKTRPDSGDLEDMDVRLVSHEWMRRYLRSGRNPSLSCSAIFAMICDLIGRPGVHTPDRPPRRQRKP